MTKLRQLRNQRRSRRRTNSLDSLEQCGQIGFLGASALVLECHRPEEKTRVQSFNDFIVFGLMAIGSFASGGLLSAYGWNTVLWVSFAPLLLAVAALAVAMRRTAAASMSQEDAA